MSTHIITTESSVLLKTRAPALPYAPSQYDADYHNQLNSVLRLYFNAIDQLIGQLNAKPVVYTFATLPDATQAQAGDRAYITDSSVTTFYSNAAGGGAFGVPVFYNGTNWKVG
jgi:hypothetical protein